MSGAQRQHAWTALLAVAFAAAGALTVYTARATPALVRQVERRHADLARLQDLAQSAAADRAAIDAVAAAGASAAPLADLVKSALPAVRADIQERETRALLENWHARRMDVMLEDVHLAEAGRLLATLEAGRPPWRAVEWQITATEGAPGRGRATLLLEGLQQSARGTSTP